MTDFVGNPHFWDEKYLHNKAGWDLKSPTPVFLRIVKEKKIIKAGKLLILGSGYGYDAVEATKEGFEVTAVDFSIQANLFAQSLAKDSNSNVEFIASDFFNLTKKFTSYFDAVYEYVTFCAIDPSRRKEYARLIRALLKPGGKFIALWFPVEKREGGPPFGVNLDETQKLFSKHLKIISSSVEEETIKPRKGREILQIYEKEK
jgi:SAM-dependent methyltransferase